MTGNLITREQFLIELIKYGNIPYIWGGENETIGLDCSGFAQKVLSILNMDPKGDQSAQGLFEHFSNRFSNPFASIKSADLGDLVFFGESVNKINHIAVCLGHGLMMEAGGGGSKTTTVEIAKSQKAKVRVVNIERRKDLVIILRPVDLPWYVDPTKQTSIIPPT